MRVLFCALIFVFFATPCLAKCANADFLRKVETFRVRSMSMQAKMSRMFESRKRGALVFEQYKNVQACINRLSIYCDSVSIFFESMCALTGTQKERLFNKYGLDIIMTFRGGRVIMIETRDRVAQGVGPKVVGVVDQYVELLDKFIQDLSDEMSTL